MASEPVRAVLLAGGLGTRLAPYTMVFPKPLVPLGDIPIMEIVLRQLRWHGVKSAYISVGHMAPLIEAYFLTRGPIEGLEISYLREDEPLGTAGALAMLENVDDDLLVCNGDILTTLDFSALVAFHREQEAALTIGVHTKKIRVDLGVLGVDAGGRVTEYIEKPTNSYECSMGAYVYSPAALKLIEPGQRLDFPDLVHRLLERGEKVVAYRSDCYWMDIGRPEDYDRAAQDFDRMRAQLLPDEKG
jgi:NDP-sugar pyrophosphorylase family protein